MILGTWAHLIGRSPLGRGVWHERVEVGLVPAIPVPLIDLRPSEPKPFSELIDKRVGPAVVAGELCLEDGLLLLVHPPHEPLLLGQIPTDGDDFWVRPH